MKASEGDFTPKVIDTGFPQLNDLIGIGGIPTKRITEISGSWSIGKTTLALMLVAQAQKQGFKTLWNDHEFTWTNDYPEKLGVDVSKLEFVQAPYAEEALDEVLEYAAKHKNALIVIDAIGSIHPRDEAEKDTQGRTIGGQAALVARFCRKITPYLSLNNIALVVLNHEYIPIMATGGRPTVMTSGGAKLAYSKALWLRMTRTNKVIKKGDQQVGLVVEVEARKNKLAPTQKQTCELQMIFGSGFSAEADKLARMVESGEIRKVGNTFWHGEVKIGVGQEKARAYVGSLSDKED